MLHALARLASNLPPPDEAGTAEDIERQSRATLAIIIAAALAAEPAAIIPEDPGACPNCGADAASLSSPYCSPRCRDIAAFVRQLRHALEDDTIQDEEKQATLGQVLWSLLGGGYPRRQRLVLERARLQLFKRDGGKCQECGAPATTFDHVTTACNRPINLRSMCWDCTKTKQYGDKIFLSQPSTTQLMNALAARIAASPASRPCDDAETWDWRAYLAKRRCIMSPLA
jgi:5-methylcytosine-specific restriction endonuclease McrA/endogenous inhibitor of DNA gyrase (YacG/DUF329 family)